MYFTLQIYYYDYLILLEFLLRTLQVIINWKI